MPNFLKFTGTTLDWGISESWQGYKNAQAYGNFQRIFMGGDFNFPNLKWDGNGKI